MAAVVVPVVTENSQICNIIICIRFKVGAHRVSITGDAFATFSNILVHS